MVIVSSKNTSRLQHCTVSALHEQQIIQKQFSVLETSTRFLRPIQNKNIPTLLIHQNTQNVNTSQNDNPKWQQTQTKTTTQAKMTIQNDNTTHTKTYTSQQVYKTNKTW